MQYIQSPAQAGPLCDLIDSLDPKARIALDTEFDRVTTFYPRLALLQLKIGKECYLIDPLTFDITPVLNSLCQSRALVLMFASAEDLEVIADATRAQGKAALPQRICDLQLIEGFNLAGWMRSLQSALESELLVKLPKEETRSDWLQRPLSASQLQYAVQDVEYLEALYESELSKFIADDPRLEWFKAEMQRKRNLALLEIDPHTLYLGVAGAGSLSMPELIRLKYLCERRYEYARAHDIALNRVITGKALCALAKFTPMTFQALASCKVNWGAIRQHGKLMISWIKESMAIPQEELSLPYDAAAPGRSKENTGAALKLYLTECAKRQCIAPELLNSKKLITNYFYAKKTKGEALLEQTWMRECIGEICLDDVRAQFKRCHDGTQY